ncbi:hypothetical protein NON00_02385 [Roseomonas sp. GC11]|uniref:hypothetical protein n=1 Tax=Roseomonas sp. GC11 TaxID=2950546 RepID=UPI00210C51F3|nr:hypothetical protein [Roseomonas sp. GC11]MCQ4158775.1 hypothetical protein [Roseomonas sp. GC11]
MDKHEGATPAQLMARAQAVYATWASARETMAHEKRVEAALEYCNQTARLKEARSSLPPLRLVTE